MEIAPDCCPACKRGYCWNDAGEVKEGVSVGKAVAGGVLFGIAGAVLGGVSGKRKYLYACGNCGFSKAYDCSTSRKKADSPSMYEKTSSTASAYSTSKPVKPREISNEEKAEQLERQKNNLVKETATKKEILVLREEDLKRAEKIPEMVKECKKHNGWFLWMCLEFVFLIIFFGIN